MQRERQVWWVIRSGGGDATQKKILWLVMGFGAIKKWMQ
jgi:hypothetical protein